MKDLTELVKSWFDIPCLPYVEVNVCSWRLEENQEELFNNGNYIAAEVAAIWF